MDDLIVFIGARLDEDEALARAAITRGAGEWHTDDRWEQDSPRIDGDDITIYDEGGHDRNQADHIVRHDPARSVREVKAIRRIVQRCAALMNEPDQYPNGLVSPRALLARQVLMGLAAIWSGHPDYQGGWRT